VQGVLRLVTIKTFFVVEYFLLSLCIGDVLKFTGTDMAGENGVPTPQNFFTGSVQITGVVVKDSGGSNSQTPRGLTAIVRE